MRAVYLVCMLVTCAGQAFAAPTLVAEWGSHGVGLGQFVGPTGIAVDVSGNVYVTDFYTHRVQKFTNDGVFVTAWGEPGVGPGRFQGPQGIAVDPFGNVYVADSGNHRIQKFTHDGDFVAEWPTVYGDQNIEYPAPFDVAVDANGDVFVGSARRVEKFNSQGDLIRSWQSIGGSNRIFWEPRLGAYPSVFLWSADLDQVQKLGSSDGALILRWTMQGGSSHRATDVTVVPGGFVHVLDARFNMVQVFSGQGEHLYNWTLGTPPSRYGPQRMAVDSNGAIFITQFERQSVQKFVDNGSQKLSDDATWNATAVPVEWSPSSMTTASGLVRGRITEWAESGHVIAMGHQSNYVVGWWSAVGHFDEAAAYANDWPGTYEVAAAREITDIDQIADAGAFEFTSYVVTPLCDRDCDPDGAGDFVIWRNLDTGGYAVARLNDVQVADRPVDAVLDATWWYQPDGSANFSNFLRPDVDIRPGRCPNLIVRPVDDELPIAIAGSGDFVVRDIDVQSILLEERLAPLSWRIEDVTGPHAGPVCDCGRRFPDGIEDLVLEYRSQDVLALLEPLGQNETRQLRLDGTLLDQTYFRGEDCVRVVGGKPDSRPGSLRRLGNAIFVELVTPSFVRVSFYDVSGRLVARPLEGLQPAGKWRVSWPAPDTPGGVYLYRIEGAGLNQSGKLVHVR